MSWRERDICVNVKSMCVILLELVFCFLWKSWFSIVSWLCCVGLRLAMCFGLRDEFGLRFGLSLVCLGCVVLV